MDRHNKRIIDIIHYDFEYTPHWSCMKSQSPSEGIYYYIIIVVILYFSMSKFDPQIIWYHFYPTARNR